jgi:hypothetical protein
MISFSGCTSRASEISIISDALHGHTKTWLIGIYESGGRARCVFNHQICLRISPRLFQGEAVTSAMKGRNSLLC